MGHFGSRRKKKKSEFNRMTAFCTNLNCMVFFIIEFSFFWLHRIKWNELVLIVCHYTVNQRMMIKNNVLLIIIILLTLTSLYLYSFVFWRLPNNSLNIHIYTYIPSIETSIFVMIRMVCMVKLTINIQFLKASPIQWFNFSYT